MARFELQRARDRLAAGRPDRAAVALVRARLWRATDRGDPGTLRGCEVPAAPVPLVQVPDA